jgi:hypothetical protein
MDPTHQLETQLAHITAYLRGELGYDGETPGSLRRQIEEHEHMIRTFDDALRGRGEDLGLVGWMMVIRRTWITLVALLGAAFGYFLNDVVDTLGAGRNLGPAAANSMATPNDAR